MLKAFQYTDDESGLPTGSAIVSDALHVVNGLRIDDDPVAYVLRSSMHGHYLSHGNGVTSLAALIGAVSRASQRLVSRGHSSREIISVFRSCATVCRSVCEGVRCCSEGHKRVEKSSSNENAPALPGIGVSVASVLGLSDGQRESMVAVFGLGTSRLTPEALAWSLIDTCLATPVDVNIVNQMAECTGVGGVSGGGGDSGGSNGGDDDDDDDDAVSVGGLVVIHGLASRPDLNGRLAQVAAVPVVVVVDGVDGGGGGSVDGRVAVVLLPPGSGSSDAKNGLSKDAQYSQRGKSSKKRLRPKKLSIRFRNLACVSGSGCAAVLWRQWLQRRVIGLLGPLVQGENRCACVRLPCCRLCACVCTSMNGNVCCAVNWESNELFKVSLTNVEL